MGSKLIMVIALSFGLTATAAAQETERRNEGAAGYIEGVETQGEGGGIDQEIDAAEAQVETAEETGKPPPGVSSRRSNQLEEIVVSARRRDELLEDTPISVTAIDADTFVEAQITRFNQLQNIVPNLRIGTGRSGMGGSPTIRGVGATESGNPGAGTYIDGIFLQRSGASLLNVVDVQQLEVLRGPQGTLFGKNTLGGAINITTVAPSPELEGSVWVRAGNYATVDTRATLNIPIDIGPLKDRVFTRFSVATQNTDGFTENLATGESFNNRSAYWLLGKVRILPVENLEVNVSANYFSSQSRGAGGRCFVVEEAEGSIKGLALAANPDFFEKCAATKPFEFSTYLDTQYNGKNYGLWGSIVYNFGEVGIFDDLNAKLLGSWRRSDSRTREDVDLTVDNIVELSDISIDGFPGKPYHAENSLVEAQVYGEAFDGRVNAVGGFFASWLSSDVTRMVATNRPTLDHVGGFTSGPVQQNESDWAFYGQGTWDLLDWLSLTGGIRYTSETRGVARQTWYPLGTSPVDPTPTLTSESNGTKTFTQWTPMGSVQLLTPDDLLADSPIDHLMGYFTYAKGFSSGGFNAVIGQGIAGAGLIPYEPALLDNFEVGIKTVAFDQKATFNISFFYMNYDDIQVTQARTVIVPGQELPETARIIVNAAAATMRGLEAEFVARPIDGLMIMTNIGVLDSEYLEFEDIWGLDSVTPYNRAGESFNGVPEFTSYLAIQYSLPVELASRWMSGWLTPRIDWSYRTKVHNTFPEDPSGNVPGYSLLNARISYDFFDDRAQVALWGQNLTSSEYFYGGGGTTGFFGYSQRYYASPATWGGELSYRF